MGILFLAEEESRKTVCVCVCVCVCCVCVVCVCVFGGGGGGGGGGGRDHGTETTIQVCCSSTYTVCVWDLQHDIKKHDNSPIRKYLMHMFARGAGRQLYVKIFL